MSRSLLNQENSYATLRLENYAIAGGWDSLSEFNPRVAPLFIADGHLSLGNYEQVFDTNLSWDTESVGALGLQAFELWPAQQIPVLDQELRTGVAVSEPLLKGAGLWIDVRGRIGGLVSVEYPTAVPQWR